MRWVFNGFGTIRNNTALKLPIVHKVACVSFGTIRNNTALKLNSQSNALANSFGTIRNNTALKLLISLYHTFKSFGTIRNNTALKLTKTRNIQGLCFGTIRNNTALKPRRKIFLTKFRNRAIRPSQTLVRQVPIITLIIPYFQGSRNSLDPVHTAGNHRLFEVLQIKLLVDWVGYTLSNLLTHPLIDRRMHWWKQGVSF